MKVSVVIVALLVCLGGGACRQQDIRTTTIQCPQVKNALCVRLVTEVLAKTDGVLADSIRVEKGTATVTYDSMKVAIKNLEFSIAEIGFNANDIPADAKARDALPADCK
jgi:copper chaperone CopZ